MIQVFGWGKEKKKRNCVGYGHDDIFSCCDQEVIASAQDSQGTTSTSKHMKQLQASELHDAAGRDLGQLRVYR